MGFEHRLDLHMNLTHVGSHNPDLAILVYMYIEFASAKDTEWLFLTSPIFSTRVGE